MYIFRKYYKYLLLLILSTVVSLLVMVIKKGSTVDDLPFIRGVLDLSEWSGEQIDTTGYMFFHPDKLLNEILPGDEGKLKHVPHKWNSDEDMMSPFGKGTYRGVLTGLTPGRIYGFKINDQVTSFNLYINGEKVAKNGDVESGIPEWKPVIGAFASDDNGYAELVIEVANYHYNWGGYWNTVEIGIHDTIFTNKFESDFYTIFYLSGLVIMGIFFIFFFLAHRHKKSPLYFSILCLDLALYSLLINERLIHSIIGYIPWEILVRVEYFSGYNLLPIFTLLMLDIIKVRFNKILNMGIIVTGLLISVICFIPNSIYMYLLEPYKYFTLICVVIIGFLVLKALVKRQKGSYYLIAACGAVVAAMIKEIFFVSGESTLPMAGFIMVITFSLMIIEEYVVTVKRNRYLEREVGLDELTGLHNRQHFVGYMTDIVNSGEALTHHLLFLDLDGFKSINDDYGHQIGDRVLEITASRMKSVLRSSDFIARYGGDEFVILLKEESSEVIRNITNRIIELINRDIVIDGIHYNVGVSVGISSYSPELSALEWVVKSDQEMYKAKSQGKNRYCLTG